MNKKGDWDAPRSVPALILGLIILAMGLFPLLGQFGILNLNLPYTPVGIVLEIILTKAPIIPEDNGAIEIIIFDFFDIRTAVMSDLSTNSEYEIIRNKTFFFTTNKVLILLT